MCGLREVVSKTIKIAKFKYVELSMLSTDLIISFQPHSNSTRGVCVCVCVCVSHSVLSDSLQPHGLTREAQL